MDQAARLRELANRVNESTKLKGLKIITITSGKGGVGKSNISVNLALELKNRGKNPLILDADFGFSNVEVLLGESARHNISSLICGTRQLEDIIIQSKCGIPFISGGSGLSNTMFLGNKELDGIINEIKKIEDIADTLIIDTGAGIDETVVRFAKLADELCLVVTPEPTSITDGYALMKTLIKKYGINSNLNMIVNQVEDKREAEDVYTKMRHVFKSFLATDIKFLGFIPFDNAIKKADKAQQPVLLHNSKSMASSAIVSVANALIDNTNGYQQKVSWASKLNSIFRRN